MYHIIVSAVSWENQIFAYAKTKAPISGAVTAQLISAFVFATRRAQFLLYLYPKFQDSSFLLWLYRPVWVGPGRNPRRSVFSRQGSFMLFVLLCQSASQGQRNPIKFWKQFSLDLSIWIPNLLITGCVTAWVWIWAATQEKQSNSLRGFQPGPTQTVLYKHKRWLEAWNFGCRKKRNCTIWVAKTKALISFEADLRLCFRIGKILVFSWRGSYRTFHSWIPGGQFRAILLYISEVCGQCNKKYINP